MIDKIKKGSFFLVLLSVFAFSSNLALAEFKANTNQFGSTEVKYGNDKYTDATAVIVVIVQWLLGFVGALSVLVIIIGGIFYIISGGESGKTETAKGYILYAVVGLIVALLGWVIVNTVVGGLNKTNTSGEGSTSGNSSGYSVPSVPPDNYVEVQ